MIERIFELSELTDTTVFYGVNNNNVHLIKNLLPNVRFSARGNIIKLAGNEGDINNLYAILEKLERFCIDNNILTEENIIEIVKGSEPVEIKFENLILHGLNGKSIMPALPINKNWSKILIPTIYFLLSVRQVREKHTQPLRWQFVR